MRTLSEDYDYNRRQVFTNLNRIEIELNAAKLNSIQFNIAQLKKVQPITTTTTTKIRCQVSSVVPRKSSPSQLPATSDSATHQRSCSIE